MSRMSRLLGKRGSTPVTVHQLFLFHVVDDDDDPKRKETKRAINSWGLEELVKALAVRQIWDCIGTVRYRTRQMAKYV